MSAKLYHCEIGIPNSALAPVVARDYTLRYTNHAIREMLADHYTAPKSMPRSLYLERAAVFEVEVVNGVTTKVCVRTGEGFVHSNRNLDLILVCVPCSGALVVKTLWFNDRNDKHATLNKSKYAICEETTLTNPPNAASVSQ